jgi:hypothetical protein
MQGLNTRRLLVAAAGLMLVGSAEAGVVNVGNPAPGNQAADLISVSTTWTANNTYNLQSQIYVLPGATLTIEPGTVIASTATVDGSGSLAVTRGGKIIAQGTCEEPIIFTSSNDVATWAVDASHPTGKDPTTGTWRAESNEWGNLTIMGNAYVSNTIDVASNEPFCDEENFSPMEGLTPEVANDPNTIFGGGFDNDDSGTIEYVSLRYGGRVIGLGDELNGLSLGGVGRATDISHVEIMNNIDDGIEIWGGTVNLKYVSIWNIGDDSFDIDQGWRGKAQFGLIVQGYSKPAGSQGSGIGDNLIECDGAEMADAQPVSTFTLYNFTLIGQPVPSSGDHALAYRDGARMQFRQGIVMDLGDKLVGPDWSDFEGSGGYGLSGSLTFPQTWNTAYTSTSLVNPCANPQNRYQAQSQGDSSIGQGFLNEITDSVFFRNLNSAYSVTPNGGNAIPDAEELGSDQLGVTVAGGSAPAKGNVVAAFGGAGNPNANMPIVALTRSGTPGPLNMLRVTSLDPRPANAALVSMATAPDDGFFTPVNYRGAFGPNENWLCGWSAAHAYGMLVSPPGGCTCPEEPIFCAADTVSSRTFQPPPDGVVDAADLAFLLGEWGTNPGSPADTVSSATFQPPPDGVVDAADLAFLLGSWGSCE